MTKKTSQEKFRQQPANRAENCTLLHVIQQACYPGGKQYSMSGSGGNLVHEIADDPFSWISETFEVAGLGASVVTGTRERGLISGVSGACSLDGLEVGYYAYWSMDDCVLAVGPVVVSGRNGTKPSKQYMDKATELIEAALEEWWSSGDGPRMTDENSRRDIARISGT